MVNFFFFFGYIVVWVKSGRMIKKKKKRLSSRALNELGESGDSRVKRVEFASSK
jgi:hypothetical protein